MNPSPLRRPEIADVSLTTLLVVQLMTQFAVLPLIALFPGARILLDLSHLAFAAVCVAVLTRHRGLQAVLLVGLALLAGGPLWDAASRAVDLSGGWVRELIAVTAFGFNAVVTGIVVRHVFGPGRVNVHRLQGAVLIYLNVAALFAIAYGLVIAVVPGAIVSRAAQGSASPPGPLTGGALSYFSLVTITTTGYGDLAPVHPVARSLANLEAVIGQLFPAIVLARLVGLNLFHAQQDEADPTLLALIVDIRSPGGAPNTLRPRMAPGLTHRRHPAATKRVDHGGALAEEAGMTMLIEIAEMIGAMVFLASGAVLAYAALNNR